MGKLFRGNGVSRYLWKGHVISSEWKGQVMSSVDKKCHTLENE